MKVKNKLRPNALAMAGFLVGDTKSTIIMVDLVSPTRKPAIAKAFGLSLFLTFIQKLDH